MHLLYVTITWDFGRHTSFYQLHQQYAILLHVLFDAGNTLLFRSYKLATRIPSTRCRRHATSPATSAVVMRCLTIMLMRPEHGVRRWQLTGLTSTLCTHARRNSWQALRRSTPHVLRRGRYAGETWKSNMSMKQVVWSMEGTLGHEDIVLMRNRESIISQWSPLYRFECFVGCTILFIYIYT